MNVLILKNTLSEGPGSIDGFLRQEKLPNRVIETHAGEELPGLSSFSHLVVLGGPMAVYEMPQYPFLVREAAFLEQAIKANKPVLGICLGAQMIAHVLGGRVYRGIGKEVGWDEVSLTGEGIKDPLLSALAVNGKAVAQVFQWHGDTFDLPRGAVLLASSALYPNQAFRYSGRVYALQFHVEVTPAIVREWLAHEQGVDLQKITELSERIFPFYHRRAQGLYREFFRP